MKDEPGVAGLASSMLEPRFIGFFCFLMISFLVALYGYGNLVARRKTGALRGRPPRRAARHLLIYMVRAVMQGLVRLIRQPAAAAAPDAIAPAPVLQSQLSTTQEILQHQESAAEEELQSNQSTVEEDLQSQLSASEDDFQSQQLVTEVELQSAVERDLQPQPLATQDDLQSQQSMIEAELLFQHSMIKEEFCSATEEELSQLSASKEDFQSQHLATEEKLQSAVEQDLQPQPLATEEDFQPLPLPTQEVLQSQESKIKEELQFQHSTIKEEFRLATEEKLQSQLSASEEDFHSQQLATEEELQSAVEQGLQPQPLASKEDFQSQQLATEEKLQSAVEQDCRPQSLATEEDFQPQPLATQEELQSQQSMIEEKLQFEHSTIKEEFNSATEEELQLSASEKDFQSQQLATEGELQSAVEQDLQPQALAVDENFQPLPLATQEELQSAVEEDLQPQRIETREELWPPAEEELHPQQSALEGRSEVAILQESVLVINIWNGGSLEQCLRNLMACFKKINHPIQFTTAHSPNGSSSSSSPCHFENPYEGASVNKNNNDQHHQFKSLLLLDQGGIYLIDNSSLLQFEDMINKQSGKSGYPQILYDVFEDNSYVLDSFLCDYLNSAGLSIDKWTCMGDSQVTYESAKICVMELKITARLLYLMKSELNEVKCEPFHQDLKDHYFTLCAGQAVQNLIEAADSISKLKWSASDIYQLLVLYEAIDDVLNAFGCPNGSDRIFQQMQLNYKGIFDEIKCFIHAKLNGSPCAITRVGHPVTKFLVHSMELLKNHNRIVAVICAGDATISVGHLLPKVIRYWVKELKKHSVSYPEGRQCIFILDNLFHFRREIKKILRALMPMAEHVHCRKLLESQINKYILKYIEKCWGPVKNCVELNSRRKPCLSSLNAFTAQFDALCNCQMTWVVETELKKILRKKIKEYIIPTYNAFLIKLHKKIILRVRLFCQNHTACQQVKHKTTEQVGSIVDELFESEHRE